MKTIAPLLLFFIVSITAQKVKKPTNIFSQLRTRDTSQSNRLPSQEALSKIDNPDTELILAASKGNLSKIEHCLFLCANANAADEWGATPLHRATINGHTNCAALLLNRGAKLHATGSCRETPLHGATINGHTKCAALLLDRGANPHATDSNKETPINLATRLSHWKTLSLLNSYNVTSPIPL